jgi:hypothetical protein
MKKIFRFPSPPLLYGLFVSVKTKQQQQFRDVVANIQKAKVTNKNPDLHILSMCPGQGVTKRSRPTWLTNNALVYEPKCGGAVARSQPMSTAVQLTQEPKYTLEI